MKEIVVIGVIALFVGVGFQPAFANEVSISIISDDTTPPEINLSWDVWYDGNGVSIYFIAICNDESGIDRVEFTLDDLVQEIDSWEPYEWYIMASELPEIIGHIVCAIAYDNAGNNASDCIDFRSRSIDIEYPKDCDCQSDSDINLNRLDKVTEIKEFSNRISKLSVMDMDNETICDYLFLWFYIELFVIQSFISFFLEFGNWGPMRKILEAMYERSQNRMIRIGELMNYYDCQFFP